MKSAIVMLLAALTGSAAAQPSAQPAPPPAPAPRPATPAAPGGPNPSTPTTSAGPEVLTLERAIEIAMRQQPSLRQTRAQVEAAQGRADLARVARNPTIVLDATAATGSAQKVSAPGTGGGTGTGARLGPDFFSHQESTGLGAS